jgi:dipeptidyl aminopeptidase/acylaminoacyl peptidase
MFRAFLALPLLAASFAASAAAPPPLSLYGQLPMVGRVALSPDGSRWAAIVGGEDSAQIQVRRTGSNELLSVTPGASAKPRDLVWAGPYLVLAASATMDVTWMKGGKREWTFLSGLDPEKGWRSLLDSVHNDGRGVADVPPMVIGDPVPVSDDGRMALVVPGIHFLNNVGVQSLIRIDLAHATARVAQDGLPDTIDWLIGRSGEPMARVDYDQRTGKWRLSLRQDGQLRPVYSETALLDRPVLLSFGRDEQSVIIRSHKSGDWEDYDIRMADGVMTAAAYTDDDLILDPVRRTIVGTIGYSLDTATTRFFNPDDAALWRGVQKAFPGHMVSLLSWSDDRSRIIAEVQGPEHGVSVFLIDRTSGKAEFMADRYKGLGPDLIAPVTTLTYKAGDGMEIPAYLTLPQGRPAKGLPLVVLAHGGPASRDDPGFDWWAQALASRGYAVLQPQFRGSTGFGEAHRNAGFGQWGRKMQSDLSDGVRHLARAGTIDPARVCIVGASYGGYAAMAGVTVEQGVYRCASAVAGVSDLRRMLAQEVHDAGGNRNATLRYWRRFMGAADNDDKTLDAVSPARMAVRLAVPLQLIHGKDDTVVPIEQSRIMADALKAAAKPVEFLTLAGEDHWLSRASTRIAMLEAQIAFLEKHNPPTP